MERSDAANFPPKQFVQEEVSDKENVPAKQGEQLGELAGLYFPPSQTVQVELPTLLNLPPGQFAQEENAGAATMLEAVPGGQSPQ